jgi:hypothetical protein
MSILVVMFVVCGWDEFRRRHASASALSTVHAASESDTQGSLVWCYSLLLLTPTRLDSDN